MWIAEVLSFHLTIVIPDNNNMREHGESVEYVCQHFTLYELIPGETNLCNSLIDLCAILKFENFFGIEDS